MPLITRGISNMAAACDVAGINANHLEDVRAVATGEIDNLPAGALEEPVNLAWSGRSGCTGAEPIRSGCHVRRR
jgi:hypothetical protein